MRLFLYLDTEKLTSLYAQEFEGIIEKFTNIEKNKFDKGQEQKGEILSGTLKKIYNMNEIEKIETKYLHDFLYIKLEEKIKSNIIKISQDIEEKERKLNEISTLSFIEVSGQANFFDTNSLIKILNELKAMENLLSRFNDENSKNNKNNKNNKIDYAMVKDIKNVFETFSSNLFEVEFRIDNIKFTSYLNEKYLREEKERIIYKLSRNTEVKVTLFGIVTQSLNKKNNVMMEEPLIMGTSIKEIGKIFLQPMEIFQELIYGKAENEIKVDPIALYLELK
ncbi:DUF6414 family protein [Fusobacterium vincentii]|uniref:DUF6414 family protein n=1 Tax=Fusobacterium vincentii TaxID=155615 RepID=UPI0030CDD496